MVYGICIFSFDSIKSEHSLKVKILMKQNILFFSRCDLTHLYGQLHNYLISDFNIIHVAYSMLEVDILQKEYGIKNVINFKERVQLAERETVINETFLKKLDDLFTTQTDGKFTLNGSIQSDRTFKNMDYDVALLITSLYYNAWQSIFSLFKIDFFIHEPVSLMMNQMASVLCKEQGGIYSTHIMVQGESKYNFIMVDDWNGVPNEMKTIYENISDHDILINEERVTSFLTSFRASFSVFFDVMGSGKPTAKLYFNLLKNALRDQALLLLSHKKLSKTRDNIEVFLLENQLNLKRLKNFRTYKTVKYDTYNIEKKFYFYPLHLEPEAVVLYWADGLYTNQIKLIENIAAQLPPDTFLYVKDHPHLYGYRDISDYNRLQDIPNVKLLPPHLPGKKIIKDSLGVITINGTAGFEALLLNKQVIVFGSAFYAISKRVKYVENIRDLKDVIYNLKPINTTDDLEIKKFVLAYLKAQKKGFTDFYINLANSIEIDMTQNIQDAAASLSEFFKTAKKQ